MSDTPEIEVSEEGTVRILKIGDLTINIEQSGPGEKVDFPPGILFDFDKYLVSLISLFDKTHNEQVRDALMLFRSQLDGQPELVGFLQKLSGQCVVFDDTNWVRIERTKWDKFMKTLESVQSPVNGPQDMYVGDDLE